MAGQGLEKRLFLVRSAGMAVVGADAPDDVEIGGAGELDVGKVVRPSEHIGERKAERAASRLVEIEQGAVDVEQHQGAGRGGHTARALNIRSPASPRPGTMKPCSLRPASISQT